MSLSTLGGIIYIYYIVRYLLKRLDALQAYIYIPPCVLSHCSFNTFNTFIVTGLRDSTLPLSPLAE